jgi:hypothetical protein
MGKRGSSIAVACGVEYKVTVIMTELLAFRFVGHGEIKQLIVGLAQ